MLTDMKLRALKPGDRPYKVGDRDGMYVVVSPGGTISFRYNYRLNGRQETLNIGKFGPGGISLAEAREKLMEARRMVSLGKSPAGEKQRAKAAIREQKTAEEICRDWLDNAPMADSTRNLRQSVIDRDIVPNLGRLLPDELETDDIRALCDKIVARGAPSTAVFVREVLSLAFMWAIERGAKFANPAAAIRPSSIASFRPRERSLSPNEVGLVFRLVERVPTIPTLRLALRLVLLTMVRKGELIHATWDEVDFAAATWTIPKERMKARRPHVVYLSQQALDIMITLKACAGESPYLLPSRYDSDKSISNATLNQITKSVVNIATDEQLPLENFTVHDLRRTASTILHEAGYNTDWIEKCLAHEQRGVRAVYNRAEYAEQRRKMLQDWGGMVDGFIKGAKVIPIGRAA